MILPEKHLQLTESVFGFGGVLLKLIDSPLTIDELWERFSSLNNSNEFPTFQSFDDFILTLDFLFSIGAIKQISNDKICYASN